MRKKVRRAMAALLALALAVFMMAGMTLSASAGNAAASAAPASLVVTQKGQNESSSESESESTLNTASPKSGETESSQETASSQESKETASSKESESESKETETLSPAIDQTATVGTGKKAITVHVTANAGVLPKGAKLTVKKFDENSGQYAKIAEKIKDGNISYDDLVAMDISFQVNGQEVEPNGSVNVKFTMGTGLFSEDADVGSLAVQHITDAGKVETVTKDVTVDGSKVSSDFTVKSFSEFAVTTTDTDVPALTAASDGTGTEPTPGLSKVATDNGDGTYDLNLSVTGSIGTTTNKAKVDVLFILACSSSMVNNGRFDPMKTAANALVDTMSAKSSEIDTKYSVVKFYGSSSVAQDWTSSASTVKSTISGLKSGSGTNYYNAINNGITQLNAVSSDGAMKVVIFLTDGEPNRPTGYERVGNRYVYWSALDYADYAMQSLKADRLYCIGVQMGTRGPGVLNSLISSATNIVAANKAVYTTDDLSTLKTYFQSIAAEVTQIACKNVTISDTLSSAAKLTTKADGTAKKLSVVIKKADGTTVTGSPSITLLKTKLNSAAKITAKYSNGNVSLDFPDSYQLENGWTYTLSFTFEPSTAAYESYCSNNGTYNGTNAGTGETGTGTYAGKTGFYTNSSASLSYTVNGTSHTAVYPMPVFQLKPGSLNITKAFTGLTADQIASLNGKLKFVVTRTDKTSDQRTVTFSTADTNWTKNTDGSYTYNLGFCVPGKAYTVTETGADNVANYKLDSSTTAYPSNGSSAAIAWNAASKVKLTNAYVKNVNDLTVTKAVSCTNDTSFANADVANVIYGFKVKAADSSVSGSYTVSGAVGSTGSAVTSTLFVNGETTIYIKGAGSAKITGLPTGSYTVTETSTGTNPADYTYVSKTSAPADGSATLTSAAADEVAVTNSYKHNDVNVTLIKKVTGNMCSTSDGFDFKWDVKNAAGTTVKSADISDIRASSIGFKLPVPYGSNVTITETDKGDYTLAKIEVGSSEVSIANDGYTLENVSADTTVTFTNDKTVSPPTGMTSNALPYAAMVGAAAAAGIGCAVGRRRRDPDED